MLIRKASVRNVRLIAGSVCLLVVSLVAWFVFDRIEYYRLIERNSVLDEVLDWLLRGEDAFPLPQRRHFDDQGHPIVGWRVELVAECLPTREHFDPREKWDSQNYRQIAQRGLGWMSRKSESSPLVMAIAGPGTAFDDGKEVRRSQIPDDTLLFVEVLRPDLNWMEPIDIDVSVLVNAENDRIPTWIRSELGKCVRVAFADGEIWCLSPDVPASAILKFSYIGTANSRDRLIEFASYRQKALEVKLQRNRKVKGPPTIH